MQDIINGRCGWCGTEELYVKYHDEEWGKTVTDDKTLFEFLVLESAQAGLSWITILKKELENSGRQPWLLYRWTWPALRNENQMQLMTNPPCGGIFFLRKAIIPFCKSKKEYENCPF